MNFDFFSVSKGKVSLTLYLLYYVLQVLFIFIFGRYFFSKFENKKINNGDR